MDASPLDIDIQGWRYFAFWESVEPSQVFLSGVFVHQPREEMVFSGKYKTSEQILRLANERFAVPEMLFHPSDIGIQEMGIPEAIVHSIQSLPQGSFNTLLQFSLN